MVESIDAIDSFMIHTCKYLTAVRRKARGKYKYPETCLDRSYQRVGALTDISLRFMILLI